jgi:hypothetical protein
MVGMTDTPPKSSYELAMERLRKKDAEGGVSSRPLTDEQKAALADVRKVYEAKIAQEDVLHQSAVRAVIDPADRDALDAAFRRDVERLSSERDARLEKIRRGES